MAKIKYNATESRWELLDNSNVVVDYAIGSEDAYPWELTWNTIQVEQVGSVDATATAGQILEGETAIVRGVKVTGTMANNGEFVFTPDASGVMKDGGYYKSIYVAGDSDLVSGNIKEGVSIFGVTGTLKEGESVDWSKVTAEASDILEGHTILKDGAMVSGTMTNFEDVSIELTSSVQTLESGYYNSITIPAKPDEGVTLPTGITVQPTDVLDGKFYIDADGNKQEGTMPNKGVLQATLEYDSQIIEGGYYSEIIIPGSLTAGVDFDLVDAEAVNVLEGYKFVDGLGNITEGSMPNNGTVNVTLTDEAQILAAGYYGEITIPAKPTTPDIPDAADYQIDGNIVTITPGIFEDEQMFEVGTVYEGDHTITPGASDKAIPADTYISSAVTIKGDSNLIGANIKEGVSIFGVVGEFKGAEGIELPTGITVTPADVKDGIFYIDSEGAKQEGTMPVRGSKTVTLSTSTQTLPAGYYESVTVPGSVFANLTASQIESATSDASNVLEGTSFITGLGTVKQGAMPNNGILDVTLTDSVQEFAAGYYGGITVPAQSSGGGTGSSDVEYGYIDADGNFQPLDLSGDTPVEAGTAESMASLDMFKTGVNEPSYPSGGGSSDGDSGITFYECASYTPESEASSAYSFTLTGAHNGDVDGTYTRTSYIDTPDPNDMQVTATWTNENGYVFEEYCEGGVFYYRIPEAFIFSDTYYDHRLTDFSEVVWVDDVQEPFDITITHLPGESSPESWSGYKMTWQEGGTSNDVICTAGYEAHWGEPFTDDGETLYTWSYQGTYKKQDGDLWICTEFTTIPGTTPPDGTYVEPFNEGLAITHAYFEEDEENDIGAGEYWIMYQYEQGIPSTPPNSRGYAIYNNETTPADAVWQESFMSLDAAEYVLPVFVASTASAGWVKSDTLTEGLTVKGYTPVVGKIYDQDATILVTSMYAD